MDLTIDFETERFRAWTEDFVRDMDERATKLALRKIAFDFLERVIDKTPVDTGRARGGWTTYLIEKGRAVPEIDGEAAKIAEGRRQGSFEEDLEGNDQFIILINAVRYLVFLEFGTSDQAPEGMMRITFREMAAGQELTKELREQMKASIRQANRTARLTSAGSRLPG